MLDRKDNQRFVSRRAFNTEVTNHRLRQSRARVLSSNQWIIIQRIVMSHSVAVGWHRRGQCHGHDRVLLDAGTLTFRVETAGLAEDDGFPGYRVWKTENTFRFVKRSGGSSEGGCDAESRASGADHR